MTARYIIGDSLTVLRTLPAGHHPWYSTPSGTCCDALFEDPIHAGDEHRIENWVKP